MSFPDKQSEGSWVFEVVVGIKKARNVDRLRNYALGACLGVQGDILRALFDVLRADGAIYSNKDKS
jgi:hypothetical protein